MVGAEDIGMDSGIDQAFAQTIGNDEIVDAPAGILLAGLKTIRPPGILHLVGIFKAEGVGEAIGQQLAELGALLVGEARIMAVGFRILDIDLLVGHVQVAAEDDGLLGIEALEIGLEIILPRHAVVETLKTVLRVGRIAAHQEEVVHLEGDDAPLMVVHVDADAIGDAERFPTGEDGGAGVAFLVGIVPIALVALEGYVELSGLHLRLLKTEEVGIQLLEYLAEALALAGTQAIDVPTDDFH